MRVIAGKARHLKLKTMEGDNTRPTTDRIKETLFNMLSFDIEGSSFLDLFAGSGGIGIEALSRGTREAVFVENNRKAQGCIRDNLTHTHLADQAVLIGRDVMTALSILDDEKRRFDYIFMDPPYGKGWEEKVLRFLAGSSLCDGETVIIVESDLSTGFSYLEGTGLKIYKEKIYKTNKHTFVCKEQLI
ncbi:MAG: 16S rRNA (guanine(966)-N(2))-methyltransferase RsmD [Eubacterium sp.]|nr:16S rRNA (guanine(966)-N(2))-methyltransferase RsmD [Eubacterium sp.]